MGKNIKKSCLDYFTLRPGLAQPHVAKPNSNTSVRIPMPHMEFDPYLATWVETFPRPSPTLPVPLQLTKRPMSASMFRGPRPTPYADPRLARLQLPPKSTPKPSQTQGPRRTSSASPPSSPWDSTQIPSSRCKLGLPVQSEVGSSYRFAPPTTTTIARRSASSTWPVTSPTATSHTPASKPSSGLAKTSQGSALQPPAPLDPSVL